ELQIRFTLTDRGRGHFLRSFGLLNLFDDFEILDLRDALTACDAIAETDEHILQAPGRARGDCHRRFADQIADDADFLIHRCAARAGEFHDHRTTAAAAAAESATTESTATAAGEIASASAAAAAASNPTTTFSARSGGFRRRTAPRAFVIEPARKSDSDDHRTDDNFSHP